jgi:hypothetical protein
VKLKPVFMILGGLSLASSASYAVAPSTTSTVTQNKPTATQVTTLTPPAKTKTVVASTTTNKPSATPKPKLATNKTALIEQSANDPNEIKAEIVALDEQIKSINNIADVPEGKWNWYQHIRLSGLVNVDASHWSKPYFGMGTRDTKSSSYLSLSEANLNVDADFGQWITAHIGFLYTNGSSPSVVNFSPSKLVNRRFNVWDAYGTIANFKKTPFYLRAGEQFVPFGRYKMFPITQSFAQILEETDLPSVQLGFLSKKGVYASIFVMSGERKKGHSNSNQLNNYGLALGYQNYRHAVGYNFGLSFLSNMANVDSIRDIVQDNKGYTRDVGGFSAFADAFLGPFNFGLRYVTALKRFSAVDYQYTHNATTRGAKPNASDIFAGYSFKSFGHHSRIHLSYQWTNQAYNTATIVTPNNVTRLPKTRWLVEYGVNLIRQLALELQFYQDHDYPKSNGATNKENNVVTARLSFLF